jgi:polysaccharide biosynthesis protein PslE
MEDRAHGEDRLCFNVRPVTPPKDATLPAPKDGTLPLTLNDLLAVGFRHRQLVVRVFLVIFLALSVFVLFRPARYESAMKLLVKQERLDPGPSDESSRPQSWQNVTEEQLNSEVELLKSHDLLARVVVATGLPASRDAGIGGRFRRLFASRVLASRGEKDSYEEIKVAQAVYAVQRELSVQPLRKSNVIRVSYTSPNPIQAAAVLKTLADRYLEKHLAVHRPSGAFDFFDQEAERYRKNLANFELRLAQYNREQGVVSGQMEKEIALKKLADVEATEQATQAQIAETARRIQALEAELTSTPNRTTTEVRTGSARLIEQLQSTLTPLELKRLELSKQFQPDYPPLKAVEAQIAALKASIAAAAESPVREETTGRDPTYAYLQTELAKSRAELAALRARAGALAGTVSSYRANANRLERIDVVQKDLGREAKQAEQNYLLHFKKREEARVADALDLRRFVNVAIVEPPTVPYKPSGLPRSLWLLFSAMLAGVASVAVAFGADYREQTA